MTTSPTETHGKSRKVIEETKVGPWISMLCHQGIGGCRKMFQITLEEANDTTKDVVCPQCQNMVRKAVPPPAPAAEEVTDPVPLVPLVLPAPAGDMNQEMHLHLHEAPTADPLSILPALPILPQPDPAPQGEDEPEPAVGAKVPDEDATSPMPEPQPTPSPAEDAAPAETEPDPDEELRRQAEEEARQKELNDKAEAAAEAKAAAEEQNRQILHKQKMAELAREAEEQALLQKQAAEAAARKREEEHRQKLAKLEAKAERKRVKTRMRAAAAPGTSRLQEIAKWCREHAGPFGVFALCTLLVIAILFALVGVAILGWNHLPSFENREATASVNDQNGNVPLAAATVTVAPPATTALPAAPPPTTSPPTTTTPPPSEPDDGVVEMLGPRMIQITLGTTSLSEKVETGESDPMIYSFTGPNNTKLPETVLVMFPSGQSGQANAEDNPNGHWDEQDSPMQFSGPAGTKVVIFW